MSSEEINLQAIAAGCGEYSDDAKNWRTMFIVAECKDNHVDLARYFDVEPWLENAGEVMDDLMCGADENGERHPLQELSRQDKYDLQACVRSAIRHWQEHKGLNLRSYWFADRRNQEEVDLAPPPEGSSELSLQMALAQIEEGESA